MQVVCCPTITLPPHTTIPCITVGCLDVTVTREHLGVSAEDADWDVTDPVDMNFYKNIWLKQASINTTVYDKVRHSSSQSFALHKSL